MKQTGGVGLGGMSGFVRCVTGEKWKMWSIFFTALYRLGGGENGDGEVDERDCGGMPRDGGQREGGMGGRSGMREWKGMKGSGEAA